MFLVSISFLLSSVAAQPAGPAGPSTIPGDGQQGMAAAYFAPVLDGLNRRVCLVERATGRQVCRPMDYWRALAESLETKRR